MKELSIIELYKNISVKLSGYFPAEELNAIQSIIFDKVLKLKTHQIFLNPNAAVSKIDLTTIIEIVEKLKSGQPLQYILGEADFYGLTIKVTPGVLIPRPETEELVDLVVKTFKNKNVSILDIGTGSGCIAIALAKNLPGSKVSAIDISENALLVAKENSRINGVNVNFSKVDILENNQFIPDIPFDVIVSNPPYVRKSEQTRMKSNVLDYEPHMALFVDDNNPLIFYKAIALKAKELLKPGGFVFCEINESLGDETVIVFEENSFRNIKIHNDINGKNRIISAKFRDE